MMDSVNALDRDGFVERFGPLFEHSPWVAEAAWVDRPFADREELMDALCSAMYAAPRERQLELIRAHPELAGRVETAESAGEQSAAGLDRLTPDEYEAFTRANRAYRERFGFPLVICAREHTKASILRSAEDRLANSPEEEIRVALGEIAKIARLRLEAAL